MNNVYFVESPLQLLSATKARDTISNGKHILYLYISKSRLENNEQIMKVLDSKWDKVVIKKNHQNRCILLLQTIYMGIVLKLLYKDIVSKVFIGEFRNVRFHYFNAIINPMDFILLDDGAFTIIAQNEYILKGRMPFENAAAYKLLNILKKINRMPNLFSFFVFDKMNERQFNYYPVWKKRKAKIKKHLFLLFGSKFYEAGLMSLSSELDFSKKIKETYKDKNLLYVPHRDESEEKLLKIKELGFDIKRLGEPAEKYFDSEEVMPEGIISYYSTVLYSCKARFSNVKVTAIDITNYILLPDVKKEIKGVYDYYQSNGIEVKQLDND